MDLDSYMAQIDEDINDESKAKLEAELEDLLKVGFNKFNHVHDKIT